MSLDITKQGNVYKKSNTGKTIGVLSGAAIGYKYVSPKIKDLSAQLLKESVKDTFVNTGNVKTLVKDAKVLNKIAKNSKVIGAAIAAAAMLFVGKVIDDNVNYYRGKKADKNAQIKVQ